MNQPVERTAQQTIEVSTTVPFVYRHRPAQVPLQAPRAIALFLHGYTDHAGSFLRRLFPTDWPKELDSIALVAPNGPFPVPVKTDQGWKEAYSWYFFNTEKNKMLLPPDTAVKGCVQMLDQLGYSETPKVLIGFSQGGFLAPVVAKQLKNVREIIGISTGFREDYYPQFRPPTASPWRLSAIHGAADEVFPLDEARRAHAKILQRGYSGDFHTIPGLKHIASPEVGDIVAKTLARIAAEEHR